MAQRVKISFRRTTRYEQHVGVRERRTNRPFPSSSGPLFQNEGRCSAFDMAIIFHSHTNKTHFHKKGCALSLILKVRVFGTLRPLTIVFQMI